MPLNEEIATIVSILRNSPKLAGYVLSMLQSLVEEEWEAVSEAVIAVKIKGFGNVLLDIHQGLITFVTESKRRKLNN